MSGTVTPTEPPRLTLTGKRVKRPRKPLRDMPRAMFSWVTGGTRRWVIVAAILTATVNYVNTTRSDANARQTAVQDNVGSLLEKGLCHTPSGCWALALSYERQR